MHPRSGCWGDFRHPALCTSWVPFYVLPTTQGCALRAYPGLQSETTFGRFFLEDFFRQTSFYPVLGVFAFAGGALLGLFEKLFGGFGLFTD